MPITTYTKISLVTLLWSAGLVAGSAYAQPTWKSLSLKGIVSTAIQALANVLIPLAVTTLILVFVYGVVLYMQGASKGDSKMTDVAKKRLLFGILILFAVFSLWGFVHLLRALFTG